jgi:23S rRNA pseudouridine2605 synthase
VGQNRKKYSSRSTNISDKKGIRLNKFLSNAGICSRREADQFIVMGLVTVNGKLVTEMGFQVQRSDEVRYDGQIVKSSPPVYILLNKPKGFVATKHGGNIKKSVQDLIRTAHPEKVPPIGDMGRTITGLLFLTNDDVLRKRLSQAQSKVKMIYKVTLEKKISVADFEKLRKGVLLQNKAYSIKKIDYVNGGTKKEIGVEVDNLSPSILVKIFEKINHKVFSMDRVMYANLTKKDLPRGRWRKLSEREIQLLHFYVH